MMQNNDHRKIRLEYPMRPLPIFSSQQNFIADSSLVSSEVSSEHRLSDVCSVISSSNSEDDAFEQETLETEILEQIANMLTQTEEEEPLLVHTEISDVSSYSSDELGLPDSELEEFGFFMTPREIL